MLKRFLPSFFILLSCTLPKSIETIVDTKTVRRGVNDKILSGLYEGSNPQKEIHQVHIFQKNGTYQVDFKGKSENGKILYQCTSFASYNGYCLITQFCGTVKENVHLTFFKNHLEVNNVLGKQIQALPQTYYPLFQTPIQ